MRSAVAAAGAAAAAVEKFATGAEEEGAATEIDDGSVADGEFRILPTV